MKEFIAGYFDKIRSLLAQISIDEVADAIGVLERAWASNQQVFVIGNGGSASTASHYACDLNKGTAHPDRARLKVMSLCDNVALFSAIANDFGYPHVFTEQLKHFLKPNDVVIGISASGNSANVVEAFQYSQSAGAKTISVVGFKGGKLRELGDCSIYIPSDEYGPVEDIQLMINHLITDYFRNVVMPRRIG